MPINYQSMRDLIEQILQDTTNAIYGTTELNLLMDNAVRDFAVYAPHIVDVTFKIESRAGTDTAGTEDELTDTTESQFVEADATSEKVVHNTTDHTWAVVTGQDSTSVLTLSADIMDSGENYRIYNKRCKNNKQIYIGDVTDYLWIDSVEYPLGSRRNWKVYNQILGVDVAIVEDSDTTGSNLPDVDVLVRFAKRHKLCQLTDVEGTVNNASGYDEGDATMTVTGFAGTIEVDDEFNLENHRTLYTVTTGGSTSMTFFPALEADVDHGDAITFRTSSLKPQHEPLFADWVVAKAGMSKQTDSIPKGGAGVYDRFERKLWTVKAELEGLSPPRTKRIYPR